MKATSLASDEQLFHRPESFGPFLTLGDCSEPPPPSTQAGQQGHSTLGDLGDFGNLFYTNGGDQGDDDQGSTQGYSVGLDRGGGGWDDDGLGSDSQSWDPGSVSCGIHIQGYLSAHWMYPFRREAYPLVFFRHSALPMQSLIPPVAMPQVRVQKISHPGHGP
ncbi:unnamed protein product [Ilex paraguariensis]|uniref:Uncharacterized protein n=1 Tax=Ilex paraguariensis TaxID=185542 RepID=A0ABC8UIK9_9AQUA